MCAMPPPDDTNGLSKMSNVSSDIPTKACASRKLNLVALFEPSPLHVKKKSDCSPEWHVENAQLVVRSGSTLLAKSLSACVEVSTVESCAATSGRTVMKSGLHGPVPICCGLV